MAQTKEGVIKSFCKKQNITINDYHELSVKNKWCFKCKNWVDKSLFGKDSSRHDKLCSACINCRRVKTKVNTAGRVSTFKGKKHTESAKKIMSEKAKLKPPPMLGRKHSIDAKLKMSQTKRLTYPRGSNSVNWKGGSSERRRDLRRTPEYKEWRNTVFLRDNYTCQSCGDNKGGNLNAHHIKPYATNPELRLDISNGITLCKLCHTKHHKLCTAFQS